jgi:hypothetical protein
MSWYSKLNRKIENKDDLTGIKRGQIKQILISEAEYYPNLNF